MIRPSWKNLAAVLLIFLTGAIFGALLFPRLAPLLYLRSTPSSREVLKRYDLFLARQLDLTKEQREQIRQLMEETQQEINRLYRESQPQLRELLAKRRERILQRLTPEQKKRFLDLLHRQRKRLEYNPLMTP